MAAKFKFKLAETPLTSLKVIKGGSYSPEFPVNETFSVFPLIFISFKLHINFISTDSGNYCTPYNDQFSNGA